LLQFGSNIWYYNKNIKSMLIGFLNLFPQMKVKTFNSTTGLPESEMTVPILFGPIERSSYINSRGETVQRTVQMPLLHFELTGMEIDKTRAFAMKTEHMQGERSGVQYNNLMPMPWNFSITMNVYSKYQEELFQLIEQIVPMFNHHRVYYTKHPIFPEEITLSHWASITTPPNFAFNYEYSAEQRRDILAVPIGFTIESWLVREAYGGIGIIKEIITNYKDYATQAGLSQIRLLGDPTIRKVTYTPEWYTPTLGDLVSGTYHTAVIVDVPESGTIIVKFNSELQTFLLTEPLRVGLNSLGVCTDCEPYEPFKEADYGWSSYSGYSVASGYSDSGYSVFSIWPPYSGYSEIKTDGYSGTI
jgi:hypothetical protein